MGENCLETDPDGDGGGRCSVKRSDLDGMSPCVAVSAAVASRSDANVLDLDPLSGVVDVDALEQLWGPEESSQWHPDAVVTFPYMDYEVSVTSDELRLVPIESGDDVVPIESGDVGGEPLERG